MEDTEITPGTYSYLILDKGSKVILEKRLLIQQMIEENEMPIDLYKSKLKGLDKILCSYKLLLLNWAWLYIPFISEFGRERQTDL